MPFLQSPIHTYWSHAHICKKHIPNVFGLILYVELCHLLHEVTLVVVVTQSMALF